MRWWMLGLAACEPHLEADCLASAVAFDYNGGAPVLALRLVTERPVETEVGVYVSELDEAGPDDLCQRWPTEPVWAVQGTFRQAVFPEVPVGATPIGDGPRELVDGSSYEAFAALLGRRLRIDSCPDWRFTWVQGEPETVRQCSGEEDG